ncbi:hypothetical protein OQA88_5135 [Cercophora sp. LCS_1]
MAATRNAEPKPGALINRIDSKMGPLRKGSKIHKRPLQATPSFRLSTRSSVNPPSPTPDLDGYVAPPRAPHTVVIKVTAKTPFATTVKRVNTVLDTGPQKTRGLALTERIAAMGVREGKNKEEPTGPVGDCLDDVVLLASGKAIEKALEVGLHFRRTNKELLVLFRTRSVKAIDDIVMDEDADEEDGVRVRKLSVAEVGIRWKK